MRNDIITAGIDCGAKNTKSIIFKDGKIIDKALVLTGFDLEKAVRDSYNAALKDAGVVASAIGKIVGTGSGQRAVKMANELINDIKAMAEAARYFFPESRTVADVGAEEGRAAKLDENGNAIDFTINERCAAGSGTFIETMSRALEIPIEQMGQLALKSDKQIPMNAQCAIFAESEVVALIHANTEKQDICRAILDAIANRIVGMIRRIGVNQDMVMFGGIAKSPGFLNTVKSQLELEQIFVPDLPEFGEAVGAAVWAAN